MSIIEKLVIAFSVLNNNPSESCGLFESLVTSSSVINMYSLLSVAFAPSSKLVRSNLNLILQSLVVIDGTVTPSQN